MDTDTLEFTKASPCVVSTSSHGAPAGLQLLPVPHQPCSHISLDFVSRLPRADVNMLISTMVNRFSETAHFVAKVTIREGGLA